MAFVHPSRMGLVPKDSRSLPSSGTRLPSPPASPQRDRSVDRYQRRSKDEEYNGERERGGRSDRSRDRDDERRRGHDQNRHHSRHRSNGDRYDDRRNENRDSNSRGPRSQLDDRSSSQLALGRASPTYDDYSRRHSAPSPPPQDDRSGRPSAPSENISPWHQQENMYRRDSRLDGGGDYFER